MGIKTIVQRLRVAVSRRSEPFAAERAFLGRLQAQGYSAAVVYDIGASTGVWSESIMPIFPRADYHLFEPLVSHPIYARELTSRLARLGRLRMHPVALGEANGEATLAVAVDAYGSSLRDRGDCPVIQARQSVPVRRLDDYARERGLPPPAVVKIDCQGFEDAILRGGAETISHADALLMETWLERGYGPQTPLLPEIIDQVKPLGFILVEFGERFYDERHRLYSVDGFFLAERMLGRFAL